MEHTYSHSSPRKFNKVKDVYKELTHLHGRDSPESGSLYSDYESGPQYEQDLPSGYNSGEQYDTLSTGYMSENYEFSDRRAELPEQKLESIEEGSTRSNENLFPSIHHVPENQLHVQTERMESSSSSSIQGSLELGGIVGEGIVGPVVGAVPASAGHSRKANKKSVRYCSSVPLDKSPLGVTEVRIYGECPSDTDTTSAFDSDGTYMRGEGLSSDSGAALISHSSGRRKKRDHSGESGLLKSSRSSKRTRRSKKIVRDSDEFFHIYDNKKWALARQICFWCSILAILISIITAIVLIVWMPRSCDPTTNWWQGSVLLEVGPQPASSPPQASAVRLDIDFWINNVHNLSAMGIRGIKLVDIYTVFEDADGQHRGAETVVTAEMLTALANNESVPIANESEPLSPTVKFHNPADIDLVMTRVGGSRGQLELLVASLHAANLTMVVEVPTINHHNNDKPNSNQNLTLDLRFNVSKAIQFWSELGVDGLVLVGLEQYAADPFLMDAVRTWSSNFEQFGRSPNERILAASYLLPERIDQIATGSPAGEADHRHALRFDTQSAVSSFHLLTASLLIEPDLSQADNGHEDNPAAAPVASEDTDHGLNQAAYEPGHRQTLNRTKRHLADQISAATRWDKVATRPWIAWKLASPQPQQPLHAQTFMSKAQLAFQMLLPGTISLPWSQMADHSLLPNQTILSDLLQVRKSAVPVYMNGNYKHCEAPCDNEKGTKHAILKFKRLLIGPNKIFSPKYISQWHVLSAEDNYVIHTFPGGLVALERHYNRRHRYILIANFGREPLNAQPIAKMYSDGEVVVDTQGILERGTNIKLKSLGDLTPHQAYILKLPK